VHTLVWLALGTILVGAPPALAQADSQRGEKRAKPRDGERRRREPAASAGLPAEVEALRRLSVILGRPTDRSITLNLLASEPLEVSVDYGTTPGQYEAHAATVSLLGGTPVEVELDALRPDTAYVYRVRSRKPDQTQFALGAEHGFHTQRAPGRTFSFEVQGDSHPERPQQFDPALYAQTLRAAAADRPDFYLTSGDDFSVDKAAQVTAAAAESIYLQQRLYLALVGPSAPLFLVNGNHEQAARCNLNGTPDNVAVWAQTCRNRLFPQPAPDRFYSGDPDVVDPIGPLRDYYAWTWGDALFVVIDPYWHSAQPVDNVYGGGNKSRDLWGVTLGETQYRWLQRTLAESKATFKFVFAHHVLGTGRGGIEQAGLCEWGGKNKRGVAEFASQRPGWELPIQPLMAKHGVTIFFQGHDHLFVRQELDGVVYQTLPEPADPNYTLYNREAYRSGDALPNSGRVRVTVSAAKVAVDYLRSYLPKDVTPAHPDGEIAFHYEIPAPVGRQGAGTRAAPRVLERQE
jgi:hypothetical protein